MRLTDTQNKIKSYLAQIANSPDLPRDAFVVLLILLVGTGAFALGRLSAAETTRKSELSVTGRPVQNIAATSGISPPNTPQNTAALGMYVGSRSGKTYHLPWCSGAKRIKEENKIWFQSKEEAEGRGYAPAGNCKGI